MEIAQQAATLNAMSGERLTLGVSQGGRDNEFLAATMPKEQRTGRLVEGVRLMRRLWTEKDVTFKGRYYQLDAANIQPKPQRPGGIPLLFGASMEPALKRAGCVADGGHKEDTGRMRPEQVGDMIVEGDGERGCCQQYLGSTVHHLGALGLGDPTLKRLLRLVHARREAAGQTHLEWPQEVQRSQPS